MGDRTGGIRKGAPSQSLGHLFSPGHLVVTLRPLTWPVTRFHLKLFSVDSKANSQFISAVQLIYDSFIHSFIHSFHSFIHSFIHSHHGLRSSDTAAYVKPRCRTKFGERGFCYAGPAAWNSLPHHLHQINDTGLFKRRLKTELFRSAYHC